MQQRIGETQRVVLALDARRNVVQDFARASQIWVAEFDGRGNLVREAFFLRVHRPGYFAGSN